MYDARGFNDAGIHRDTGTQHDLSDFKKDGYNDEGVYRDDFPTLAQENASPREIWSDGTTMWVLNNDYDRYTKARVRVFNRINV